LNLPIFFMFFVAFVDASLGNLFNSFHIQRAMSADSSLGKVDKSSFSQQTLMELFIQNIVHKELLCRDATEPADISEWTHVDLNAYGEVDAIHWQDTGVEGQLGFQWLPDSVRRLCIERNVFSGIVDCRCLPPDLESLEMEMNAFSGSLDLDALPRRLEFVNFNENRLSGEVSLTNLPPQLEILFLSINELSGSVNLEALPKTMDQLFLHDNAFSGTVCLTRLPSSLSLLTLDRNHFCGTLDLTSLPPGMFGLDLSSNDFEGWTDFSRLPITITLSIMNLKISGEIHIPHDGYDVVIENTDGVSVSEPAAGDE